MRGENSGQEGNFFVQGDPANALATAGFVAKATRVYAVLRAPPPFSNTDIPGTYQIVFEPGMVLSVDEQGVTCLTFGYDQPGPGQPSAAAFIATGRFGPNPEYLVRP